MPGSPRAIGVKVLKPSSILALSSIFPDLTGILWRKFRRIQENVRLSSLGRLWMNILVNEYESLMISFRIDRSQPCIIRCDWLARSWLASKDFSESNLSACQSHFGRCRAKLRRSRSLVGESRVVHFQFTGRAPLSALNVAVVYARDSKLEGGTISSSRSSIMLRYRVG